MQLSLCGPEACEGDWNCPRCQDLQFHRNPTCRKCGMAKPAQTSKALATIDKDPTKIGGLSGQYAQSFTADWNCPVCFNVIFGNRSTCFMCGCMKPSGMTGIDAVSPAVAAQAAVGKATVANSMYVGVLAPGSELKPSSWCSQFPAENVNQGYGQIVQYAQGTDGHKALTDTIRRGQQAPSSSSSSDSSSSSSSSSSSKLRKSKRKSGKLAAKARSRSKSRSRSRDRRRANPGLGPLSEVEKERERRLAMMDGGVHLRDLAGQDWAVTRADMLRQGDESNSQRLEDKEESKKEDKKEERKKERKKESKPERKKEDRKPEPMTELNVAPKANQTANQNADPKAESQAKPAKKKKKKITPEEEEEKRRVQRERRANRPGAGVIALED